MTFKAPYFLIFAALLVATRTLVSADMLVRSITTGKCLQVDGDYVRPRDCNMLNRNQAWSYDSTTQALKVLTDQKCLDGNPAFGHTFVYACADVKNHKWTKDSNGKMLSHDQADSGEVCLEANGDEYHSKKAACSERFEFVPFTSSPTLPPTNAPTNAPTKPTPSVVPRNGSGSGDPHFKTWSGGKFDFHGRLLVPKAFQ